MTTYLRTLQIGEKADGTPLTITVRSAFPDPEDPREAPDERPGGVEVECPVCGEFYETEAGEDPEAALAEHMRVYHHRRGAIDPDSYGDVAPASVCGVRGHYRGHWADDVLGIWWCPDCGTEVHIGPA